MATAEKTKLYKNFTDLVKDFKQGKTSRLYLFFGEERFLMEMALAHLKKFYLAEGAESFDFYMKDQGNAALDLEEFSSLVGSPPFLSKARVTVIRDSGWWGSRAPSNAKEQEAWKAKIASIPEYSCVVFLEEKVDKRKKSLIDAVSQNGEVFEFMIQSEEDLSNWIRKQLSSANISISPDCLSSLISRVDSSMRMLRNEVLKIMLYCENKGVTKVDMPLLDKLSIPDVHASVFKMTDAIGMKDAGSALLILNDLILLKEPVPKIRLMLARHFRQLICAKELGDANAVINELKVRPFVARNLITQARGFTIEQLERIYGLCFDSDQWVKTGRMEDRTSLEVLLSAAGKI